MLPVQHQAITWYTVKWIVGQTLQSKLVCFYDYAPVTITHLWYLEQHLCITWTNTEGIKSTAIGPWGTNLSEIQSKYNTDNAFRCWLFFFRRHYEIILDMGGALDYDQSALSPVKHPRLLIQFDVHIFSYTWTMTNTQSENRLDGICYIVSFYRVIITYIKQTFTRWCPIFDIP